MSNPSKKKKNRVRFEQNQVIVDKSNSALLFNTVHATTETTGSNKKPQ